MDENEFDPYDMAELEDMFDRILREQQRLKGKPSVDGYSLEFSISMEAAREMLRVWLRACLGDDESRELCFRQYSEIMKQLHQMVSEDET